MKSDDQAFWDEKRKKLHAKLSFLADQRDTTLYQLEKCIGLSQNTLSKCNTKSMHWESLFATAEYLNTSMDFLTDRTQNSLVNGKKISPAAFILLQALESLEPTEKDALLIVELIKFMRENKSLIL